MLFLAASVFFGPVLDGKADPELEQFSRKLNRQVASVSSGFSSTGVAVLIGSDGLFMVHQSGLPKTPLIVGTMGGRNLTLRVVTEDKETGLTLLQASPWAPAWGDPVKVSGRPSLKGEKTFVMTIEGLRRSTVSNEQRVGQVRPSLRYVPLSEMRLEEKRADVTGAVAFTPFGELVGVLSGVAPSPADQIQKNLPGALSLDGRPSFGPGGLEVGFAYGPVLLERVVAGFLSPDRKVKHPSIGVFFRSAGREGAALELVMPKSPAQTAGLQEGDVVLEAGGRKITGPVDFAVVLFDQRVGENLQVKVRRGQAILDFSVRVGVQGG